MKKKDIIETNVQPDAESAALENAHLHSATKTDLNRLAWLVEQLNATLDNVLIDDTLADVEIEHIHTLEDGTVVKHSHAHTHTQTKAVLNRMSRLIGHLNAVKRMIENGRDCSEILTQLAAVDAAIRSASKVIIRDHVQHCLVEAVQKGDEDAIKNLSISIEQFIK